jgi:AraC-like DNA-binding protein
MAARTYVKTILVLLLNHFLESPETKREFALALHEMECFLPLVEFLETNSDKPIGVEDGARAVGITTRTFACLIRKVTGHTFHQYLNRFRVEKAKILLAGTQKPIAELCQEVGFCDQSYFGYVFRRVTNMTPLRYRHENNRVNQHGLRAQRAAT